MQIRHVLVEARRGLTFNFSADTEHSIFDKLMVKVNRTEGTSGFHTWNIRRREITASAKLMQGTRDPTPESDNSAFDSMKEDN